MLAAVAGAGVDDVLIELDAAEPPILDGSARPFLEAIVAAGFDDRPGRSDVLRLADTVRVVDGESVYVARPADTLTLEVSVDYGHPVAGAQSGRWDVSPEVFARELAPARTFGFLHEVEALRAKGLIKGATTQNAIVLDASGVVDNQLRWPDEFVRHKIGRAHV